MAIYRKTKSRPLPQSATIFEKDGQTMAQWVDRFGRKRTARVTTGRDGSLKVLIPSDTFTARFRSADGRLVESTTGCTKKETAAEDLRAHKIREERIKVGLLSRDDVRAIAANQRPILEHLETYLTHLAADGDTDRHIKDRRAQITRLIEECGFQRLTDITQDAVELWMVNAKRSGLTVPRKDGSSHTYKHKGMAAGRRNVYRAAILAFLNWAVDTKKLAYQPLARLKKANERLERRHVRRAFTVDELIRLLDAATHRPLEAFLRPKGRAAQNAAKPHPDTLTKLALHGRAHALIYKTLALTGLRKEELAAIQRRDTRLQGKSPALVLRPEEEKNRKGAIIPIRPDLAAELSQWLADNPATDPLSPILPVPANLSRVLDKDMAFATPP
jgi:hypothetical protein